MKIAVLFESKFSSGGSYTYSLNTILKFINIYKEDYQFEIYTYFKKNKDILKKHKINNVKLLNHGFVDKIILKFIKFKICRFLLNFFNFQSTTEKNFLRNNIDLVFYPVISKTAFLLKKINLISSILDLCHIFHNRDFPEITKEEFEYREILNQYCLNQSVLIITNSIELKKQISSRYKINKSKIINIPLEPNKIVLKKKYLDEKYKFKYRKLRNIFFYPAQIWSHKNHISIIKSYKFLKHDKFDVNFVFSGRDKGHKKVLTEYIEKHKYNNFFFTGYIEPEELDFLYKNCRCVIMTSYFGPTNLPPLEAFKYNKPLIYNKSFKHEIGKNNCFLVNVDKSYEISNAIKKIILGKYPKNYKINAKKKIKFLNKEIKNNILNVKKYLNN